jgi:hypothetical protein
MQEDVFYALAVETHGCLGEEFQRFMRKCARRNAAIGILEDRFATEERTDGFVWEGRKVARTYYQKASGSDSVMAELDGSDS